MHQRLSQILRSPFGPVAYAGGTADGQSRYRILYYDTRPPHCSVSGIGEVEPQAILTTAHGTYWSFAISAPLRDGPDIIHYRINGKDYAIALPDRHTRHDFRIAYAACNGSEADSPLKETLPGRNSLWENIHDLHQAQNFNLLVLGGDQIYADSLWKDISFLNDWRQLPRKEQYAATMPDEVFEEVRLYYQACYLYYWSQPHIRDVLPIIPIAAIWDDHDIFDGWGSWNRKYQASPVYQGIFRAAREAFYLFQRGMAPPAAPVHAGLSFTYGNICFIAPDLRSDRTRLRVMGGENWRWFKSVLEQAREHNHKLLLASSVPLATSHFSALDPILTGFPSFIARRLPKKINPKQFADDIHDQWRVPAHRDEWYRMLNALLDYQKTTRQAVTVLSGEIHLGARSTIRRADSVVHQFISSGIAHPPVSNMLVFACELLSKGVQDLKGQIDIRMERFFPTGSKRYLNVRNWLELSIKKDGTQTAVWHGENADAVTFTTGSVQKAVS